MSHHLHVIPVKHLHEVWWQLIEVWHSWEVWHLSHYIGRSWHSRSQFWILKVLEIAGALFGVRRSLLMSAALGAIWTPLWLHSCLVIVSLLVHYDVIGDIANIERTVV